MSDAVSALDGASFDGFARIADAGPRGMITLRGDLTAAKIKTAVKKTTGAEIPGQGAVTWAGETGAVWMSPDEILLLCPDAEAHDLTAQLQDALSGTHHLAANVSDARALLTLTGLDAREVLAKLTPADVSPAALRPGQVRRTRLAQVPAAFWMRDEESFDIVCFRSVAQYVFDILKAAATPGSEVGFF